MSTRPWRCGRSDRPRQDLRPTGANSLRSHRLAEVDVRVFLEGVVQHPLRLEQEDLAALLIRCLSHAHGWKIQRLGRLQYWPPGCDVREPIDRARDAVLGAHAGFDHVELQAPDDADDRIPCPGDRHEHLQSPSSAS